MLCLRVFEEFADLELLVVQSQPGAQVEQGGDGHPDELDGHAGLSELVLGDVDDAVGSGEGDVVDGPVEAEDGVEDDADQTAELVLRVLLYQLQRLLVLDHELAYPHELACTLQVDYSKVRVTGDFLHAVGGVVAVDGESGVDEFEEVDKKLGELVSPF